MEQSTFSFEVFPGECVGIVGQAAAGRAWLRCPSWGSSTIRGEIENGAIELQGAKFARPLTVSVCRIRGEQIGFIFQDPQTSLNPLFTVGRQMIDVVRAHRKV